MTYFWRLRFLMALSVLPVFLVVAQANAQELRGLVYDSLTGQPVQFANVYFAQTSIGGVTSASGNYAFGDFKPGKYNLTVSFIGYRTFSRLVEIDSGQSVFLSIPLIPGTTELPEIYVRADNHNWEYNSDRFQYFFLGRNRAADECEILNPEVLYYFDDQDNQSLYAHASEPLRIRNEHLGYEIIFDLRLFELQYGKMVVRYEGIPRYEEVGDKNNHRKYERNRVNAYRGSMLHFFRSLYHRNLSREYFDVQMLFKVPNKNKLPDETITERIRFFSEQRKLPRKKRETDLSLFSIEDSLNYYAKMRHEPDLVDSLGPRIDLSTLLNSEGRLNYRGHLKVTYYPPGVYLEHEIQSSVMLIREPVWIYPNGYVDDFRSIYVEGYWARNDTVSKMLPMDYDPSGD